MFDPMPNALSELLEAFGSENLFCIECVREQLKTAQDNDFYQNYQL
jgi:hypothetical protein